MKRTREESNEQDNERELKRAKMTYETIENVPDELLIVILGRMSAKQGVRFRSVCSRWNKLLTSNDYWKAKSISKWGTEVAPNRLSVEQICAKTSEYLIPLVSGVSKYIVDWKTYYIARYCQSHCLCFCLYGKYDTELTTFNARTIAYWENIAINMTGKLWRIYLREIIPVLVRQQQDAIAMTATTVLLGYDREIDSFPEKYAKDYIVLFNKIRPSLPDCAWKILHSASAIHEEYMFKWMIEEMIKYGTEPLKPKVTQIGKFDFKYPDDAYRISLLISNPHPYFDSLIAKLHKILLSTAKEAYYQTTDTRIKASALAALQIYSMRSEQQIAENLAWPLDLLKDKHLHPDLVYAAVASLFQTLCNENNFVKIQSLPQELFSDCVDAFAERMIELPSENALFCVQALSKLFQLDVDCSVINEDQLTKIHTNLFKILKNPNSISGTIANMNESFERIADIGAFFAERLVLYLPEYRNVMFTIAGSDEYMGNQITAEKVVTIYLSLGLNVLGNEFYPEAFDIIKSAENQTIPFEVRLPYLYAYNGTLCIQEPGANIDKIIATLLEVLPLELAEYGSKIPQSIQMNAEDKKNDNEEHEYAANNNEANDNIENDNSSESDHSSSSKEDLLLDRYYIPFTEQQTIETLANKKFKPLFLEPLDSELTQKSPFIEPLNPNNSMVYIDEFDSVLENDFYTSSFSTIYKIAKKLDRDKFLPYLQKTFHFLLGFYRIDLEYGSVWFRRAKKLFLMIIPYLDNNLKLFYSMILVGTLTFRIEDYRDYKESALSRAHLIYTVTESISSIPYINFVLPLEIIDRQLQVCQIFKNAFNELSDVEHAAYNTVNVLRILVTRWPRSTYKALGRSKIENWMQFNCKICIEMQIWVAIITALLSSIIGLTYGIATLKALFANEYDFKQILEHIISTYKVLLDPNHQDKHEDKPKDTMETLKRMAILIALHDTDENAFEEMCVFTSYQFDKEILDNAFKSQRFNTKIEELNHIVRNFEGSSYLSLIY